MLLWCTYPVKSSRDPWPLREVLTYRPNEPLCNTTYHVRRTYWVFHWNGTLQFSVSHLSSDSAWGCSIPVKKSKVASPLEWVLNNSLLCCKQTDTCHRSSVTWLHIPSVLKRSHSRGILILAVGLLPISLVHSLRPLKRHSDICRGIAAYIASSFTTPTQEAYWYLPWYCYWFFLQTHSTPLSSGTSASCVDFLKL